MFIIPYIRRTTTHNNILVNVIKILTVGGKDLWEETDAALDIKNDILKPNGIFIKSAPYNVPSSPHLHYCEVDSDKTALADFYKWEEISPTDNETFCWKTYIYLMDADKNVWLPVPETDRLTDYKVSTIIDAILSA
jgi:hypothetical protein